MVNMTADVQNNKRKKLEQNVAASIGMSENNYGQFNNVINQQATFFGETCHISPNIFKAWACFFVFLISVMTDPILSP